MRLLIVASPIISRGGVYSWLCETIPILRRDGWTVGLAWAPRVTANPVEVDWECRVNEGGTGRIGRVRGLKNAVREAVEAFQPDRVLSVLPQSDLACARAVRGAPWTALVHGRPYPAPNERSAPLRLTWRRGVRWAYRRADRVVTVCEALAHLLEAELGLNEVSVVHNGVVLPPADVLRPREGRCVGFVGRLSVEKGPDLFLESVCDVDCDARVFGNGPLEESVRLAAGRMPHVRCEGWKDRDVALEAIDLLVMPSRREGLPLVCLEAGARGIPVLARDVGGFREILGVDPVLQRHCLLGPSAGPTELGARIGQLLGDVDLRIDLARRLRKLVAANFALPAQALKLSRLLARL